MDKNYTVKVWNGITLFLRCVWPTYDWIKHTLYLVVAHYNSMLSDQIYYIGIGTIQYNYVTAVNRDRFLVVNLGFVYIDLLIVIILIT